MLCPFSYSTNSHAPLSAEKWRLHRVGLNPQGGKKTKQKQELGVTFSSKMQQWSVRGINVRIRHNSAVRMKHFPTQEETKLQLRCEGGRCWDLPKRCWKTGSQHRVTQLLFSCQTTNTNRQLGFWLAWIQIETKTDSGSTHHGNMLGKL